MPLVWKWFILISNAQNNQGDRWKPVTLFFTWLLCINWQMFLYVWRDQQGGYRCLYSLSVWLDDKRDRDNKFWVGTDSCQRQPSSKCGQPQNGPYCLRWYSRKSNLAHQKPPTLHLNFPSSQLWAIILSIFLLTSFFSSPNAWCTIDVHLKGD